MDSPGDDHGDRDADCDITHKLRYLAGVVLSTVAGNFCVARDKALRIAAASATEGDGHRRRLLRPDAAAPGRGP